MTQEEWENGTDPLTLLTSPIPAAYRYHREFLGASCSLNAEAISLSPRKMRLLACAVYRLLVNGHDEWAGRVILDAERYAETGIWPGRHANYWLLSPDAAVAARLILQEGRNIYPPQDDPYALQLAQAKMVREVVGSPFPPLRRLYKPVRESSGKLAPAVHWLTPQVLQIAQAIYQERAWNELPVLADALEEAGCPAEEVCEECQGLRGQVKKNHGDTTPRFYMTRCPTCRSTGRLPHWLLEHLRSPGPHVLGCWGMDLILGKE